MEVSDPYGILGVSPDATDQEVQTAYRARARDLHPDRNPREDAAAAFARVRAAYDLLRDPERRALVDGRRGREAREASFPWTNIAGARAAARRGRQGPTDGELDEAFDAFFGG